MTRQILVPLDGSQRAETILPQAAALARATARAIRLLLVEPMVAQELLPALIGAVSTPISAHPNWPRSYLAGVAARLTTGGIAAQAEVLTGGDIGATILERAGAPEVDLIAMATHGRTGLERWIMGSVAERVLHDAPKPLLMLRSHAERTATPPDTDVSYRTILVALDGSLFAAQALSAARTLAEATGATLVLLAVAPTVDDIGLADGGIEPLWMLAECEGHKACLQRSLDEAGGELRAAGLPVRIEVLTGAPVETILRVCAREAADVLVMATHGRGGLRRLLLGSVASGVLRHADLPVLLIRPQTAHPRELVDTLGSTIHASPQAAG